MTQVTLGIIEQAISNALEANANLAALCVGGIFDSELPRGAATPGCVFQYVSGGDENTNPRASVDGKWRVECIATTRAAAVQGAGYIYDALLNASVTIPGTFGTWTMWRAEQDQFFSQVEHILGVVYYRKGGFYLFSADNA